MAAIVEEEDCRIYKLQALSESLDKVITLQSKYLENGSPLSSSLNDHIKLLIEAIIEVR